MEMLRQSFLKSLDGNRAELRRLETEGRDKPSRSYQPNGKREVARRLKQLQRKQEKANA